MMITSSLTCDHYDATNLFTPYRSYTFKRYGRRVTNEILLQSETKVSYKPKKCIESSATVAPNQRRVYDT